MYDKKNKIGFSKISVRVKPKKLELVHIDVWGSTLVQSIGKSSYFITFIDHHIRKV